MIGPDSRYATCILYVDDDQEFIGTRQRIDASPRSDDVFHTVVEGDRMDLIAYRYLGDAKLWWVICDYNDVFYPLDMELGAVLRMPSVEHLQMKIMA